MPADPKNLNSPPPNTSPEGLMTAEEVWNEIGWPVDNPNAQSFTPIEAIEATITRVLRSYEGQVMRQLETADSTGALEHVQQDVDLSVDSSGSVGVAPIPGGYLPYLFRRVVAPDGTPLAPTSDIHRTVSTGLAWDDYRHERAGDEILVLPTTLDSVTAWLVPRPMAVEHVLQGRVPEINQEILQAARGALERRTEEAVRIKQESLTDA